MLALYGHPFSSYTWKAQIALHALGLEYDFRVLEAEFPEHGAIVAQHGGPHAKFPVLVDDGKVVFEATSIIEYLNQRFPADLPLIPADAAAALDVRTMDRVFDNYVMNTMQGAVAEAIRHPGAPDPVVLAEVTAQLRRTYAWLEEWLAGREEGAGAITLVECAAAPSLFYADWVEQIGAEFPRLSAWRAHLVALPAVSQCIEAARPFRSYFPLGAPDRD
ncbi:glutathione S-transferase family protein [Novosphingobium sp.]|uniref:glutathione S-transferase family protein n=1 Tax=Novosphingobium sp. TaxID=1874826 RepID=UPI003452E122